MGITDAFVSWHAKFFLFIQRQGNQHRTAKWKHDCIGYSDSIQQCLLDPPSWIFWHLYSARRLTAAAWRSNVSVIMVTTLKLSYSSTSKCTSHVWDTFKNTFIMFITVIISRVAASATGTGWVKCPFCRSVLGDDREFWKNGWLDRVVVWGGGSDGPKEPWIGRSVIINVQIWHFGRSLFH